MTVFEPRIIDLTTVNDTTHPNFSQVIFNMNHIVKDIEPHPDTILILEIQIPAPKGAKRKNDPFSEKKPNGYLLKADNHGIIQDDEDDIDPNQLPQFQTYAWTILELFNYKHDLKRGTYKVPIYRPPTIINIDTRDISTLDRISDTMAWIRITHPQNDEFSEVRCDPSYYHVYTIPEIHNFAAKIETFVKPEKDPNYRCEGVHAFFHWADGFSPDRHIRIAVSI